MALELAKITKHMQENLGNLTPRTILKNIRWNEASNQGSIYDIVKLLTGCTDKNMNLVWTRITQSYPEVLTKCKIWKFPGARQRDTPVADTATLVEIAFLCPGKVASQFRRQGAELLCRALAGDLSLGNKARIFVRIWFYLMDSFR